MAEIPEPNFGCGPTQWSCLTSESFARIVVDCITAMGDFIADMFVNAFKDASISESAWKIVGEQFWFWAGIMTVVVATFMVYQAGIGAILRDHKRITQATIGGLIAIPASVWCVQIMQRLVTFGDDVTTGTIQQLQKETLAGSLLRALGMIEPAQGSTGPLGGDAKWQQSGAIYALSAGDGGKGAGIGFIIIAALLVGILSLAALVLYLFLEIRNMGLEVLGALAPIALVFIGQPVLVAWAKRWVSLAIGLILAKPIAAGVLVVLVKLTGTATAVGPVLVLSGGVFLAAFAPIWAVKMANFVGEELGSAFARRASTTQQISKMQTFARMLPRK